MTLLLRQGTITQKQRYIKDKDDIALSALCAWGFRE